MKKIFLAISTLFIFETSIAQQSEDAFWKRTNENAIKASGKRQIIPQKYLSVNLNTTEFKAKLFSAPLESKTKIKPRYKISF